MALNIKPLFPLDHPPVTHPETGPEMINQSDRDDTPLMNSKHYPQSEGPYDLLKRKKEQKEKDEESKKE
ncbi:MAG: hypothetical protein HOM21_09735, partial [Halobacteriovoraceae bacterium]|nr:hypothetical protein [Halobacteriovoraceae bacterium]